MTAPSPILFRALLRGILVAVAVACGGAASGGEDGGLEILRPAPEFELETLAGDTLRFSDLGEKKAILMNFWASWCAPCRAEIPDLIALHEAYASEGFMVLGVTVNDLPRDSREFEDEMEMTYPSVIGTPAMLEAYQLSPWLPTTLLVMEGSVVREWVGPRTREEFERDVRVALGKAPTEDGTRRPPDGRGEADER